MIATNALRSTARATADRPPASATVLPMTPPQRSRRRVRAGEPLYRIGEEFRMLYVVRMGVFKSTTLSDDGLMQVTGFHMTGDAIGLDGIDTGRHQTEAVALEDSEVFALPFAQCEQWSHDSEHGQRLMMRTLAREIVRNQEHMIMLGSMRADQRLATFLLDQSERFGRIGYSRTQFRLRMTRQEIGSYLGLKLETVSRLLSRFHLEGVIHVQGKSISLLDLNALLRVSGTSANRPRAAIDPILDRDGRLAACAPGARPTEYL